MTANVDASPLDRISLWAHYKRQVWNTCTPQANTVHNIMRVVRAIRTKEMWYVSVPITSGLVLYHLLLENPELDRAVAIEKAIEANYTAGCEFTGQLTRFASTPPVLYPADLTPVHEDWEQIHFQALWLSLIAEKATRVYMMDGWQFSNGGCEEFVHVMQLRLGLPTSTLELFFWNTKANEASERERMRKIGVLDQDGFPITMETGLAMMKKAYAWITARGFEAPKIARCIDLLQETQRLMTAGFYQ